MAITLNGNAPVISPEDSFRLIYLGSYGKVLYDKATNTDSIETVKGPLPTGKYVWDGTDYLGGMEKGETRFVPFDVVRVYFGDPRSIMGAGQRFETRKGEPGDIAPRPEETRRLSVLYGLYSIDNIALETVVPNVEITMADGSAVVCPAFDPKGEHIYGHIGSSNESHDLATTIEQMRNQIKLLEEQHQANEKRGNDNSGKDVTIDGPPQKRGTAG